MTEGKEGKGASGSGKAGKPIRLGAGQGLSDQIEREVQRRLADRLSAAGVRQGELSLEVLYMIPTDFKNAYVRLFQAALREDLAKSGTVGGNADEQRVGLKQGRLSDRGRLPMVGSGAGKRYRNHWIVRSDRAFKTKQSIDRKLVRLANEIARELAKKADDDEAGDGATGG